MYSGPLTFRHFLLVRFDKPPLQWRFHKMYVRLDWYELRPSRVKLTEPLLLYPFGVKY